MSRSTGAHAGTPGDWWAQVEATLEQHGCCALVTVAEVRGSAPREAGARMLVRPDGRFSGTIGGGALEWQAIAAARRLMDRGERTATLSRHALGPDLGQCCGGSVRVLTETLSSASRDEVRRLALAPRHRGCLYTVGVLHEHLIHREPRAAAPPPDFVPGLDAQGRLLERFGEHRRPLYLFGAGHVGRALMLALAPLPFEVTWADTRQDMFPGAVPTNVTPVVSAYPPRLLAGAPAGAFTVVMTHSHPLDLAIVHAGLLTGRFPYVGVIGSDSKRARFCSQLRRGGVPETTIARLICPIGIDSIRSRRPEAIALAVAAELLGYEEALADLPESASQAHLLSAVTR